MTLPWLLSFSLASFWLLAISLAAHARLSRLSLINSRVPNTAFRKISQDLLQRTYGGLPVAGLVGKPKRVSLGQPSQRVVEPNAAVNSDESDDAASEASHQTAQSSHPQTHRERKEQKEDFQFLVARLKTFKQGQNFAAWQASNIAALAEFHHLPQTLLINAVEQKLDTKVQKLMEPMMAKVRTLEQFLTVLGASFGPDTMNLNKRLGSVQQRSGQNASQFVDQLASIYDSCNCTLPNSVEEIMSLVPKFSQAASDKIEHSLQMHLLKHNVLAFSDLQRFAKQYDERASYASAKSEASSSQPESHEPQKPQSKAAAKAARAAAASTVLNNAQEFSPAARDDCADSNARAVAANTRAQTAAQRDGTSRFRGAGGRFMARGFMLQAREAPLFPLPDPILAAATSSSSSSEPHLPPVQPESVQVDDGDEWESEASLILPTVDQLLADDVPMSLQAALCKAAGRPRKAEQIVPTDDELPPHVQSTEPVQVSEGNMHERAWKPIFNNSHHGRKIANAQVPSMPLEQLVRITEDPEWHAVLPMIKQVFVKHLGQAAVAAGHASADTPAELLRGGVSGAAASSSALPPALPQLLHPLLYSLTLLLSRYHLSEPPTCLSLPSHTQLLPLRKASSTRSQLLAWSMYMHG